MKEKPEIIQSPEQIPDHLYVTYVPTYLIMKQGPSCMSWRINCPIVPLLPLSLGLL